MYIVHVSRKKRHDIPKWPPAIEPGPSQAPPNRKPISYLPIATIQDTDRKRITGKYYILDFFADARPSQN